MNPTAALHPPLDHLYRDHHAWLTGWLRRRTGCGEQARDLAQDTFLRLLHAEPALHIQQPRAYLSRVAQGLMVDGFRRRRLEQAYLEALAARPAPVAISPEEQALMLETLFAIDTMLDNLGPRSRQIFLMAQIEGLSYARIGQRLGVSVTTVKNHLVRALAGCMALAQE